MKDQLDVINNLILHCTEERTPLKRVIYWTSSTLDERLRYCGAAKGTIFIKNKNNGIPIKKYETKAMKCSKIMLSLFEDFSKAFEYFTKLHKLFIKLNSFCAK